MRLMIASDIHGSAKYCRELLSCMKEEQPDRLLLLGDLLYHGPRNDLPEEYAPKLVISMLNEHRQSLLAVRGNCDAQVDQMVLDFPILADYCIVYWQNRMIFATHGHQYHPQNLPPLRPGDILLNGHTHVTACEKLGDYYYLNPGSVSLPKENSKRGYILLTDAQAEFKDLQGRTFKRFQPCVC
ncbi:MAG: phosphodiesterase [Lachnospiraceae bacterium]